MEQNKNLELILKNINEINTEKGRNGFRNYISGDAVIKIRLSGKLKALDPLLYIGKEETKRAISYINDIFSPDIPDALSSLNNDEYAEYFLDGVKLFDLEKEARDLQYGE